MTRRLAALLTLPALCLALVIAVATPAAAVTNEQKIAKLTEWTQTSVTSFTSWNAARLNQGAWSAYGFDWGTDYCSSSPDNPLGFDFTIACWRHDFGYRNWKLANRFPANKSRVDSAFYEDLKRKCATYNQWVRPACTSLAWVYYQAVVAFGSVSVSQADLDRAATLKKIGEAEKAAYDAGVR
jgi:hypothetical protein